MDDNALLAMVQQQMMGHAQRPQVKKDATEPDGGNEEYQWEGTAEDGPTENDIQFMRNQATDGVLEDFSEHFGINANVNWTSLDDMYKELGQVDRNPKGRRYIDPDGQLYEEDEEDEDLLSESSRGRGPARRFNNRM